MNSSRFTKALLIMMTICLVIVGVQARPVIAQQKGAAAAPPPQKGEQIPPDSDYMFRKYSAAIDQIKGSPDQLLAWVKANPLATRSIAYAAAYYGQAVSEAMKSDPQKALAMIQTFKAAAPNDETLTQMELSAYYQAKNYPKAAELGEKMYAKKPSLEMAELLVRLYGQANNQDKVLAWSEKIVADAGVEKGFAYALQSAEIYSQRKNNEKALALYGQIMGVYGDKVPPNVQEAQWNVVRAGIYSKLAADSYAVKKDFPKAMEQYEKVTKFAPTGDEACVAYYFIGMMKWQNKDQKGAIEPLAKAVVLNKAQSAKAREYAEQLYKNENGGKLDGFDEVLAKAKADLGIR